MYKELEETNKSLHKRLGELEDTRAALWVKKINLLCKINNIDRKNLTRAGIEMFLEIGPENSDPSYIFKRCFDEPIF